MKKNRVIAATTICILTGIQVGNLEIFGLMRIGFIFTIGMIFSVIGLTGGLLERNSKVINLSLKMIGLIVLCGLSIIISRKINFSDQLQNTNELIVKLEEYKSTFGKYPDKLTEIVEDNGKNSYSYRTDSNQMQFHLYYLVDGWHQRKYSSYSKIWTESD